MMFTFRVMIGMNDVVIIGTNDGTGRGWSPCGTGTVAPGDDYAYE